MLVINRIVIIIIIMKYFKHPGAKLVVRGAQNHFGHDASYSEDIYKYVANPSNRIGLVAMATPYANQGLGAYLRKRGVRVSDEACFRSDWPSFWRSLTEKQRPTKKQCCESMRCIFTVLRDIHRTTQNAKRNRVLILCQMGRNRSFTLAFLYFLFYSGSALGRMYDENLSYFKKRSRLVDYDPSLQKDGHARLGSNGGWNRALRKMMGGSRPLTCEQRVSIMNQYAVCK